MKSKALSILLILLVNLVFGQEDQVIESDNFDQLLMESVLQESINKVRSKQNLPTLLRLEALDAAAFDQAEYNQKNNKEGHDQSDPDKKDVTLRVRNYGGLHYEMGELIYTATIGIPIKTTPGASPITISTYEQAGKAAVELWLDKPDTKEILLDQSYFALGVAASYSQERNEIAIITIIASPPFDLKGEKDRKDEYALNEYNKTVCDAFNRKNPFLPELLSDKVSIEEGSIYLDNTDRELLSEILNEGRDGFAVDLVSSDQFDCKEGNGLYPSNFHEGMLLRPIKGGTTSYKTPEGEFLKKIKLGDLPKGYDPKSTNINLLLFKDAVVCNYIPFNKTDAKNLHWIDPQWELQTSENTEGTIISTANFNSSDTAKIKDYLKSLSINKDSIVLLDINYNYSPVIIDSISPIRSVIEDIISSYFSKPNLIFSNKYDEINSFIANRTIALDMIGLSEKEKLEVLKSSEEKELVEYLKSIHQTNISVGIVKDLSAFSSEELKTNYLNAIRKEKMQSALAIQSVLIDRSKVGDKVAILALNSSEIDQTKPNLTSISNAVITQIAIKKSTTIAERENLRRTLLGLHLVDKSNQIVAYNLCLSILYAWELGKKAPVTPEEWEEYFTSASSNGAIDAEKLKRLSTNFHLLSADYYYDKGDIRERKKSLESAFSNIISTENSIKETIMYAQYFMFQLQIKWAAAILQKELKKGFQLDLAEQLISISSYPSAEISQERIDELLINVNQENPKRFCELFNSNKAHYLYLKSNKVKSKWCDNCKN